MKRCSWKNVVNGQTGTTSRGRGFTLALAMSTLLSLPLSGQHTSAQTSSIEGSQVVRLKFADAEGREIKLTQSGSVLRIERCQAVDATMVCSPILRGTYHLDELKKRQSQLQTRRWVKNLILYPAGIACSTLLGATIGGLAFSGEFIGGTVEMGVGMTQMVIPGIVHPQALADGAGGFIQGLVRTIVASYGVIASTTLGFLAGLPGSWLALKVWLPPYKMASDTLRLIQEGERLAQSSTAAQDTERPGASTPLEPIEPLEVEIVMDEKLEDFLDHLRIALAPLQ